VASREATITVRLRLYGELAQRAGHRRKSFALPRKSLLVDFLRRLVADNLLPPETFRRWLAGEVTGHLVVHNDEQVQFPADLDRPLSAGDEVAIIPWIVGGGSKEA